MLSERMDNKPFRRADKDKTPTTLGEVIMQARNAKKPKMKQLDLAQVSLRLPIHCSINDQSL